MRCGEISYTLQTLMAFALIALGFLSVQAYAETATDKAVNAAINEVKADCASFENGTLTVTEDAVTRTDLTGDGETDAVVDTQGLECSSAASLYCGTGGCSIFVIVGGTTTNMLVKGWKMVDWAGDRIMLTQIHGANCGGDNLRRCYRALVWNDGAWRSVGE